MSSNDKVNMSRCGNLNVTTGIRGNTRNQEGENQSEKSEKEFPLKIGGTQDDDDDQEINDMLGTPQDLEMGRIKKK